MDPSILLLPLSGLLAGIALGFVARRNFFCTLSALEQYWYTDNSTGLRTWAFATWIAIATTQVLSASGWIATDQSLYLTPEFAWFGAIAGGIAFGFGMALVGTCGFGALVRLGGGSLKSLMAILVLGLAALSTQRGILAFGRVELVEPFILDFSFAGGQSIPSIVGALGGAAAGYMAILLVLVGLFYWIFRDADFRQDKRAIWTGVVIGSLISFGWLATSLVAATSFAPVQVESASFVVPIADVLVQFGLLLGSGPDYGAGMVVGVVIGSAIAARIADDVRWEACDDARELSRHIFGASLMGFGGVLALGCTIGQGVSAASLLAISVPISMASIILGARLGLSWLLEGSMLSAFKR